MRDRRQHIFCVEADAADSQLNLYSHEEKNDDDLADAIIQRINDIFNEDGSVWGK